MAKSTWRQVFRYRFDSFMAKGGVSIFLSLLVVFSVLLAAIAVIRLLVYFAFGDAGSTNIKGPFEQIYVIFLVLTDPGNMAQDINSNLLYKITAILAGMFGVIIVSMLIAFITTALDQKLLELKKGHSKVIEQDHTLILGWNDRVVEILRELVIANESEANPCVVILSEEDKELMDDNLKVNLSDPQNTRIVTRSGPVSSLVNLEVVSVTTCKSVIVLARCADSASADEKAASDARVVKTILGVMASKPADKELNVVAELFDERNRTVAEAISPGEVITIDANDVLAKILVQTSRSTGLSVVYGEMMSFDGCENYFYSADWKSATFGQVQFHFPDGVPFGIRRDGEVQINPPIDTVMQPGDDVLILAEDDSTIEYRRNAIAQAQFLPLKSARLTQEVEHELIVGWNTRAAIVIREYAEYVKEGSSIRVLLRDVDQETLNTVKELRESLANIDVQITKRDPMRTETLEAIEPWKYNNIIIFSQGGEQSDPETTDSETIVILLLLRQIFEKKGADTGRIKLISEVMDSKNSELVSRAGVNDFIISNRFISMLMAQISEEPDIKTVYDQLFSEDGSEIYLKPASLYFEAFPIEVTFADMMGIAQKREEVCLGVKIKADERASAKNFGVKLIPEKKTRYTLNADDSLVVVSEDET